jgi:uncharacterized protein YfaS (alpha-2-macroglobulin family)
VKPSASAVQNVESIVSWSQSSRSNVKTLPLIVADAADNMGCGSANVTITAETSAGDKDGITRSITIHPRGFPVEVDGGGMVIAGITEGSDSSSWVWHASLPSDTIMASVRVSVMGYSTPDSALLKAVEALIRQPCGCFEQTSSVTYPMTMAAQYLMTKQYVSLFHFTRRNNRDVISLTI